MIQKKRIYIAGLAGLLWGIFLRDKSGVDVLLERSSAFVLLAVLLVIAGCVLFVVGIRNRAGQKKIIKETEKSSGIRTVQEKEKVQTGQPEQNGEKVWRKQNDPEEQKLQWQQEQIREEWKEKKLRYENLKEQQRELQPDEAEERLRESISVTDWKFLYGTERGGFRHTG